MKISIFWFRRDLRLHDNAGLYHALQGEHPVLPLFIFDRYILDELPEEDARVEFIHGILSDMKAKLEEMGSSMSVHYGRPQEVWKQLLEAHEIAAVYTNHDYEPYAKTRDGNLAELLVAQDIAFHTYKDHVIFEKEEVVKKDGDPYTVFTPYSKIWKKKLDSKMDEDEAGNESSYYLKSYDNQAYFGNFLETEALDMPTLKSMGFKETDTDIPDQSVPQKIVKNYDKTRNFPAINGTSRLGIHFRFGTISIREKARKARQLNETFLNELIWRDFYSMILYHFPKVIDKSFREKYDAIPWRNDPADFEKWCVGKTGYPIVDAGMRELNATGYMHNRVRMITASFLTKHLLIDWRWGEAYFAKRLLDYDLASNNGGWQWAAGGGTDAAPYFRIFNPTSQQQKFDKEFKYIKQWVEEYGTDDYPEPMVDHKAARERCLTTYKNALG